jgi:hypothetical protein
MVMMRAQSTDPGLEECQPRLSSDSEDEVAVFGMIWERGRGNGMLAGGLTRGFLRMLLLWSFSLKRAKSKEG